MSLDHTAHAERARALDAYRARSEAERDAEVKKHEAAIAAAREAHVVAVAEAMRAAADRRDELDAAIVADTRSALDGLLARFGREPRLVAETLGGLWRVLNERAMHEIGEPLAHVHLAAAFVRAMGPEAIDRAGTIDKAPAFAELGYRAVREMLAGAGAATLEEALRATERDVEAALRYHGTAGTAERFAVLCGHASARVARAELACFDVENGAHDAAGARGKHEAAEHAKRTQRDAHGLPHDEQIAPSPHSPTRSGVVTY